MQVLNAECCVSFNPKNKNHADLWGVSWRGQVGEMAADLRDAPVQAAKLALQIGSAVADGVSFVTEIGEQWTLVGPILTTLKVIRKKVETVKSNREELKALQERCTYITACVVVKCRRVSSKIEVEPLEACVKAIKKLVEDCIRRQESRCAYLCFFAKANTDKNDIEGLKERLKNVEADLSLAGIATVEEKVDSLKIFLVSCLGRSRALPRRTATAPMPQLGRLKCPCLFTIFHSSTAGYRLESSDELPATVADGHTMFC